MSLTKLDREILEFIAQHPGSSIITIAFGVKSFARSSIIERIEKLVTTGCLTKKQRPIYKVSRSGKAALERKP